MENSAGGYAWSASDLDRLRRFLVLGAEGGTYYVREREFVKDNVAALAACVKADGPGAVRVITEVSTGGRAPKNDPALFALAYASVHGDEATRRAAYEALPEVARIGTHLFHFAAYRELFGGWSRGLRRAVGRWYTDRSPDQLAYQLVKYRQRDGWSHRDLLRLAHPKTDEDDRIRRNLFDFACGRLGSMASVPPVVEGFRMAEVAESPRNSANLIREYKLPREAVKTEHLSSPEVWEALLDTDVPMTALIRNLATMTRVGLLTPMSEAEATVAEHLADAGRLTAARVHPIAVLSALAVYSSGGRSGRSQAEPFEPSPRIVDALNAAFYAAFGAIEPANKRTLLALDVSGSMTFDEIAGVPGLTPRDASAAMALVTAATEPTFASIAFSHEIVPLAISGNQRLDDVVRAVSGLPFGGTDCALPMLWALNNNVEVDHFVVYTDNETWAGAVHPAQALRTYRERTGINARMTVVGMTANEFTVADPTDPGMLDVAGFDTATPNVVSSFARGDF